MGRRDRASVDIARLQVAVDDAFGVRMRDGIGDTHQ